MTATTATSPGRRWASALAATSLATMLLLPAVALGAEPEPAEGGCAAPLVSYSLDGQHGDDRAVAIVAQSLEQGVPGWSHVAWQAAPGTTIASVLVLSGDTTTVLTGDLTNGVAEGVERIDLCGTTALDELPIVLAASSSEVLGADRTDAGADVSGILAGAAVGAVAGGLVLLSSRRTRPAQEVAR